MNKEQEILLDLLVKLDRFFSEHNITYYIDGGTAIGAIRHNGFLPWDDDADVYVTRKNYDKLLSVAGELEDIGVVLGCYELYENYTKTVAKFTDLNDTAFVKSDAFHGLAMGQHIDIFVLDPVPREKVEKYYKYFNIYSELLTYNYVVNENIISYIDEYEKYEKLAKRIGRHKVLELLKSEFTKYTEENSDCYALRWGQIPIVYQKYIFGNPRKVCFEGNMLSAAQYTEDFLRTQFGDSWKMIPQKGMEITHNMYIDHDICGLNYSQDFSKFINIEKAEKDMQRRKKHWIKRIPIKIELEKEKEKFKKIAFEIRFNDLWNENSCSNLFQRKQYSMLLHIFEELEAYSKLFSKEDGFFERYKEKFVEVLYLWSIGGRYYISSKYIESMGLEECESEDIKKIICINGLNHKLNVLMENWQYEDAWRMMRENTEQLNNNADFIKAYINIGLKNEDSDIEKYVGLLQRGLIMFPEDGEFIKLKGDIELLAGNKQKAMEFYQEAVNKTQNGLIRLDIKKKYGIIPNKA